MKTANFKSFTLIELMVAVFILAVGITGILAIFPIGLDIGKSSQMTSVTAQLGQAKIEEIVSKSYSELLVASTTEDYGTISGFPSYKRQVSINYVYVDANKALYPDQSSASDTEIKKITVKVFWKSPLGVSEKNIKIESLISKR